ncbi:hypothetical protein SAMN05421805_10385 [Saccharopolyspora antimicrobica]|uniref:Uncharacterized protein n=1 Tax=Saccharopolyspora antimicrobica TaxID=455193 RepID=A0A1I4WVJ7_9PSEU|nr:hypothetical protein [Saccharopolyspora antimicrobica]RKT82942.1 hypothetical protein ATL45_1205 [Saccharopolyspora antimicrobica]SFN17487.1 hypothetical protein SAMN05421805_10385 [Saccharopolyspora antimicrobica]
MAELNVPVGARRNTPAVNRLKKIGEHLDALHRELVAVRFLEANVMQKKDFDEITELADRARQTLFGVRDAIAEKGGPNVAKGYVRK